MYKFTTRLLLPALTCLSVVAFAQGNNPLITLNEHGNGSLLFPGGTPISTPGVIALDPGPGGLPAALTYNLLGPPSLVAGDLILLEPGGISATISDIIRFNPAGTGTAGYPASVVFYSDNFDGVDAIADTGFPGSHYPNLLTVTEVGPEGNNGFLYTPTAGQPGFVAGFSVTYNIISDDVVAPEPATVSLIGISLAFAAATRTWRRSPADSRRPSQT